MTVLPQQIPTCASSGFAIQSLVHPLPHLRNTLHPKPLEDVAMELPSIHIHDC